MLVYGTAFGLLLAALNVYLRDMQYLVEVLLMLLMWASPIVYSWNMVANGRSASHGWLLAASTPTTRSPWPCSASSGPSGPAATPSHYPDRAPAPHGHRLVVGLVLLFVFQRVFARLQGNFAQEL